MSDLSEPKAQTQDTQQAVGSLIDKQPTFATSKLSVFSSPVARTPYKETKPVLQHFKKIHD